MVYSTVKDDAYCKFIKNPKLSINNLLQTKNIKQVLENRKIIKPIIETVLLCCHQNIPLRGYRDWGQLFINNSQQNN